MQKDVGKKERCGVCGVLMLSKCVSLPKIIIEISPYKNSVLYDL